MEQGMPVARKPSRQLTKVHLGGKLGKVFSPEWELMVSSPAEAIRAININTKGKLFEYLSKEGRNRYYRVALQEKNKTLAAEELGNRSGNSDIYIWPTVKGRNSGAAKIIAGVALLALVIFAPEIGLPVLIGHGAILGGYLGAIAIGVGTSLIMGGISQLLAPHPKTGSELESNVFQGSIASAEQGGCVPVVYGKALVTPMPISIAFRNADWLSTINNFVGVGSLINLPGGGYEVNTGGTNPVVTDGSAA